MLHLSGDNRGLRLRDNYLPALMVFACTLAVYLITMPRTVVFEDDGIFILAAYFNGIAHPPGYPLFTLIAHLATLIPFGRVAARVHAVSAIFGAATCVCLYLIILTLIRSRLCAFSAAVATGCSQVFWSQAVISEVYTLNTFIYFLLFFLALRISISDTAPHRNTVYLGAFLYGLGLSNHWPLLILCSPAILVLLWPKWKETLPLLPRSLLYLVAGLLPYAWMVLRSNMDPRISFLGPLESFSDFWFYVSRKSYVSMDTNISADYYDKLNYAGFVLRQSIAQFGYVSLPLIILGFVIQWRSWRIYQCLALFLAYLGCTFILVMALGFEYDMLHQLVFKVYPLIAYAVLGIWLACGMAFVLTLVQSRVFPGRAIPAGFQYLGGGLIALSTFFSNLPYNYRTHDNFAEIYARVAMKSLEPDAIFFNDNDLDTGAFGYLHLIEGVRPDITLYQSVGLIYSNRLFHNIKVPMEKRHDILSAFLRRETRPIYYSSNLPLIYGSEHLGFFLKVDKDLEPGLVRYILMPELLDFLENISTSSRLYDSWEKMVQTVLQAEYCRIAAYTYAYNKQTADREQLQRICRDYAGLIVLVDVLLDQQPPDLPWIENLLTLAGDRRSDATIIDDYSKLNLLYGRYHLARGDPRLAREYLKRAINDWRHPDNAAYELYKELNKASRAPVN